MNIVIVKQKISKYTLITLAVLLSVSSILGYTSLDVEAISESELRNSIESIETKIANNEQKLQDAENQAVTLQNQLFVIRTDITTINDRIYLTELKITELEAKVKKTRAELQRQEEILNESLVELYKHGNITTLEMLASSESFSDFFAQEEYLERIKSGIEDSVGEVKELELSLESQQKEQENLLAEQQANRTGLVARENEQTDLLDKTKGEEAKFQTIVADLEEQRKQAEQELNDYLASLVQTGNYVSLGRINGGDILGYVGSTGYSFGPHLHFEMRNDFGTFNPMAGDGVNFGWLFPVPSVGLAGISQNYGCQFSIPYATACDGGGWLHSGLDVGAASGAPVVAPAAGDIIFRGWWGGYGNMVLIRHDNGVVTAYGHLLS